VRADVAYADDLVSIVATPELLQDKADVMLAWSLLSNVKMNFGKLRTFGILRGADKNKTEHLAINGEGWSKILVDINHDGIMTHLGIIWNMDINNDKQFETLKETMELVGAKILRHKGRVGDKLLALEYCMRSDIVYRMQFCTWGFDRYQELDLIYTRLVKKVCRNMQSYPATPLWMLAADGGIGLQSLIDFTHKTKLRLLLRNIERDDDTGRAFQGLIARALRDAGTGGMATNQAIGTSLTEPNWATSLVEWLARIGLCVEVQGPPPPDEASKFFTGDLQERHSLYARGISLQGENDFTNEVTRVPLRVGQCWDCIGKVYEIIGFSNESAECLELTPTGPSLGIGTTVTVDNKDN
jgi:hypothetical protein